MDNNPPTEPANQPATPAPEPAGPSYFSSSNEPEAAPVAAPVTLEPTTPVTPAPTPADTPAPQAVDPAAAPTPAAPTPATTPIWKRLPLGLLIGLGALVIVIAALIISYFVIKGNADKAADTYTSSAVSYLKQVYDTATSASGTPVDTTNAIAALQAPKLNDAFLGTLSSKYSNAQNIQKTVSSKLSDFNSQTAQFVAVYNFEKAEDTIDTQITTDGDNVQSATSVSEMFDGLNAILVLLKELQTKAAAVNAPSDLKSTFSDLSSGYQSLINDYATSIADLNNSDINGTDAALAQYESDYNSKVSGPSQTIDSYYDSLSDKFTTAATTLSSYANTIKD